MTRILLAVFLVTVSGLSQAKGPAPATDEEIRKAMIEESIAAYPGRCPCPYHSARNGSACGGRSAYSRPGGRAPLCYPKDISEDMVRQYRRTHP
jgi:hypothetical protein